MTALAQAGELAAWIASRSQSFEPCVYGDAVEAFVSVLVRDARGGEDASPLSFRFSELANAGSGVVSVDPFSGNTSDDARAAFEAVHLGGRPVRIRRAKLWAGQVTVTEFDLFDVAPAQAPPASAGPLQLALL